MTRINSNIDVTSLSDEHLLAEHREIKRLPSVLNKAIKSGSIKKIPGSFRLGSGHVLFFLDKMKFVKTRYEALHNECIRRNFNVTDFSENFNNIDNAYFNDWKCSNSDNAIVKTRIVERIKNSSKQSFHYCGEKYDKKFFIDLLR